MTSPILWTTRSPSARLVAVVVTTMLLAVSCGSDDETSGDLARFCDINAELEQLEDFTTARADRARELVDRTRGLLAEAEDTSPQEIRSAARATAESFREILDFYSDADFDVDETEFETAIDSGVLGTDPPEAEVLFDWIDQNCSGP